MRWNCDWSRVAGGDGDLVSAGRGMIHRRLKAHRGGLLPIEFDFWLPGPLFTSVSLPQFNATSDKGSAKAREWPFWATLVSIYT